MQSKHEMATAPDGNGGIYAALHASGVIDDMEKRGIRHVYAYCVDNALVKVGDPTYVGFCALRNVEAGAKVIAKAYPEEAVGVFTRRNGEVHVVEYSEMPPSWRRRLTRKPARSSLTPPTWSFTTTPSTF